MANAEGDALLVRNIQDQNRQAGDNEEKKPPSCCTRIWLSCVAKWGKEKCLIFLFCIFGALPVVGYYIYEFAMGTHTEQVFVGFSVSTCFVVIVAINCICACCKKPGIEVERLSTSSVQPLSSARTAADETSDDISSPSQETGNLDMSVASGSRGPRLAAEINPGASAVASGSSYQSTSATAGIAVASGSSYQSTSATAGRAVASGSSYQSTSTTTVRARTVASGSSNQSTSTTAIRARTVASGSSYQSTSTTAGSSAVASGSSYQSTSTTDGSSAVAPGSSYQSTSTTAGIKKSSDKKRSQKEIGSSTLTALRISKIMLAT